MQTPSSPSSTWPTRCYPDPVNAPTESRPHDPELPYVVCEERGHALFTEAPYRYSNTVELPVSPEQLFAIFDDPDSWSRWATGIGGVEWTSPKPLGTGATRTVTFWGGMKVYEDFFDYAPPHTMAFHFYGTSEAVWVAFGEHYTVEPTPTGCRFTWQVAYEPTGVFGRLHPMLRPIMALNFKTYMWRLKRYCRRRLPQLSAGAPDQP